MIVILFVVITPFLNSNYLLLMHAIIVPFIMIHWILNDNTCMLTTIEKHIRERMNGAPVNTHDCFTCRLIDPIYDFKSNYEDYSNFIYLITTALWFISLIKLTCKWRSGEINSLISLFDL